MIYHSYWKWPIYTWFTYHKWWVVHSYVKLNQRLNPMTFQEKSWFPSCFPPMLGLRAEIWSFTLAPPRFDLAGWRTPKVWQLRSMKRTWPGRLMRSRRGCGDVADWRIIPLSNWLVTGEKSEVIRKSLSPSICHLVMKISQKVAGYKAIDSWEKSLTNQGWSPIRGEAWRSITPWALEDEWNHEILGCSGSNC